jgi:hypothetical protein
MTQLKKYKILLVAVVCFFICCNNNTKNQSAIIKNNTAKNSTIKKYILDTTINRYHIQIYKGIAYTLFNLNNKKIDTCYFRLYDDASLIDGIFQRSGKTVSAISVVDNKILICYKIFSCGNFLFTIDTLQNKLLKLANGVEMLSTRSTMFFINNNTVATFPNFELSDTVIYNKVWLYDFSQSKYTELKPETIACNPAILLSDKKTDFQNTCVLLWGSN